MDLICKHCSQEMTKTTAERSYWNFRRYECRNKDCPYLQEKGYAWADYDTLNRASEEDQRIKGSKAELRKRGILKEEKKKDDEEE
jgi:hypothetical protein